VIYPLPAEDWRPWRVFFGVPRRFSRAPAAIRAGFAPAGRKLARPVGRPTRMHSIDHPPMERIVKPIKLFVLTLLFTPLLALSGAHAADLTVEVKGIGEAKGEVIVAIHDKAEGWLKRSVGLAKTTAVAGSVKVSFPGLAEGDYAVSAIHDLNSNGKLDTNLVGMPIEPYGFSNDAIGNFGPAKFDDAKFKLGKDSKTITISLG
jgi:uncharacterized protein (DUF2141 family)